jgi:hypothetical protein
VSPFSSTCALGNQAASNQQPLSTPPPLRTCLASLSPHPPSLRRHCARRHALHARYAPSAYARHRGFKCPVLFAISDNDRCISLRGYGWLEQFKANLPFHVYECDGNDLGAVFRATREASDKVRRSGKPAALVYSNLARRFGHAGTDRQSAYLTAAEIEEAAYSNPLEGACAAAVAEGIVEYEELSAEFELIAAMTEKAFEQVGKGRSNRLRI